MITSTSKRTILEIYHHTKKVSGDLGKQKYLSNQHNDRIRKDNLGTGVDCERSSFFPRVTRGERTSKIFQG